MIGRLQTCIIHSLAPIYAYYSRSFGPAFILISASGHKGVIAPGTYYFLPVTPHMTE